MRPVPRTAGMTRSDLRARDDVAHWDSANWRWWVALRVIAAGLVLLAVVAIIGVIGHAATFKAPTAVERTTLSAQLAVAGRPPALPWPAAGQAAVAIPEVGLSEQSGAEQAVPVASVTKIMTGYIVLHDHPLPPLPAGVAAGARRPANGPLITMGPADVAEFGNDLNNDESNIQVNLGEVLTERQVIDGMLVRSANDLALTLARWDAGSVAAFVAKMNATAASLGMHDTHFVDPSGYDPHSMSTASDMLKVATLAMDEPAFAAAVTMRSVTLPVEGTVPSYTPLVGTPGVVGVKSGFTTAAGACDVLAAVATVAGHQVTVLAAVFGVQGYRAIPAAGAQALTVANAAAGGLVTVPVVTTGDRVGTMTIGGTSVPVVARSSLSLLAWPSTVVDRRVSLHGRVIAGDPSGTAVGAIVVSVGRQSGAVPLTTSGRLPPPTLVERLF